MILKADYYTSEELYKTEVEKVFLSSWLFACFLSDIPAKNDYIVKRFPFGQIVVRNAGTRLQAFFNICPHRFSKLFLEDKGNAILECPYHGWRFNDEGIPYVIPFKKECFGNKFNPSDFKLSEVLCETVGEFVFIKIKERNSSVTIHDFLGENFDYLEQISKHLSLKIDENKMIIKSNWKLIVENSLEDYHLLKVHPNTLAKILSNEYISHLDELTSSTTIKIKESSKTGLSKLASLFLDRYSISDYNHKFIFPNLAISTTEGISFFVQEVWPISVTQSQFVSHGFLTNFKPSVNEVVVKQLISSFKDSNRTVFLEDAQICEGIQETLSFPLNLMGKLGSREDRVQQFQEIYLYKFDEK